MPNYTQAEDHSLDRALLAFVTAEQVPYSKKAIKEAYEGRQLYVVLGAGNTRPLQHLPDQREGDDERLIIALPTSHPLLTSHHSTMLHPDLIDKGKFKDALKNKYGLNNATLLNIPGKFNRDDDTHIPSQNLLLISQEDIRRLAVQALEKLSDPAKAQALLELDHKHEALPYRVQLKDPDSSLVEMVTAIYHKGGFEKGDADINRIMEAACTTGMDNFDFAILLRNLDDPSKAKKPVTEKAQRSSNPLQRG